MRFADAATVLDDPLALTIEDRRHSEQRFVTVGSDLVGTLLVVAYRFTDDGDVRLISARRAAHAERRDYENEDH